MIRAHFYIPWANRKPIVEVGEYPWWVLHRTENGQAVVVAYESGIPDLSKQWPDMFVETLLIREVDEIVYSKYLPNTCSWWRVK